MRGVDWFFVVAVLLLAAGLRFIGLAFGEPDPRYMPTDAARQTTNENIAVHPDEHLFVQRPLRMLLTGQLNPKFFHNPSFLINLNLFTYALTGVQNELTWAERDGTGARREAPFYLYLIGRAYSALGGLLAVAATYATVKIYPSLQLPPRKQGGRAWSRYAAGVAALLVAVSFPMVQHAHYATTSSLAAGFTMCAIWASLASLKAGERWRGRLFMLAGICAGLAAGNRYNAAAVSIVVFAAGWVLLYRYRNRRMLVTVLIGWLLVPAVFVFTTPHIIFDTEFFLSEFRYITSQYLAGEDVPFTTDYGLWFDLRYLALFGIGMPASIAGLIGLWAVVRATYVSPVRDFLRRNSAALFTIIMLLYLIPYSLVVLRTVRPSDQMLVPIIPQAVVFAGLGAGWLYERLRKRSGIVGPTIALTLMAVPLTLTVPLVRQFVNEDTRYVMQAWIYDHLPAGSRIHLNGPYNVPLDEAVYTWTQEFGGELLTIEDALATGADYIILSDAWYFDVERSGEIVPEADRQHIREYLIAYQGLTEIARIERPIFPGYDWTMNTASYWHNPGLTIYCTTLQSCNTIR